MSKKIDGSTRLFELGFDEMEMVLEKEKQAKIKPSKALECIEEEIEKLETKLEKDIRLRDKLTVHQHRELENCCNRILTYEKKLNQFKTIKQALIQGQKYKELFEWLEVRIRIIPRKWRDPIESDLIRKREEEL